MIGRDVSEAGHLLNAEIARMRQDTGIEMGQQSGSEAGGISRMHKCREKRVQVSTSMSTSLSSTRGRRSVMRAAKASALAGRGAASNGDSTISSFSTRT